MIDLEVHDFGLSLFESQPSGIEIRGCRFFNAYWDGPDRSHGPGLYLRNPVGGPRKTIEGNIVFQHGRQGLQGFGSVPFAHVTVEGNAFFNNGIAGDGFHRNLMFGNGSDEHEGVIIRSNLAYLPLGPARGHEYNLFGGAGGSHGLELVGNWLVHPGREAAKIQRAEGATVEGNRIVGGVSYSELGSEAEIQGAAVQDLFPLNDYYEQAPAEGCWIWMWENSRKPNLWDGRRRLTVGVLNWASAPEIEIDLTELENEGKIAAGAEVRICSVQAPSDWRTFRLHDGEIVVSLDGWGEAAPIGRDVAVNPLPPTLPAFGVFLLEWPDPGWVAEAREPQPIPDPGADLPAEQQRAARIEAWRVNDPAIRVELLQQRRRAWRAHAGPYASPASTALLIFSTLAKAEQFRTEVEVTALLEGGAGPVWIGVPTKLADGRAAIAHRLTDVDADWIRAMAEGFELQIGGLS
ncbi:MAG: hypothetical protein GC160_19510 [Acidobacteria bacterium]|nr:hypothetical protein [Acidobacteriota bacterium]